MGANNTEGQSWLRYGEGLDSVQELLTLGADLGLISKAGAWYSCDFMDEHKKDLDKILKENDIDDGEEAKAKFLKFQGQALKLLGGIMVKLSCVIPMKKWQQLAMNMRQSI